MEAHVLLQRRLLLLYRKHLLLGNPTNSEVYFSKVSRLILTKVPKVQSTYLGAHSRPLAPRKCSVTHSVRSHPTY